jgi:2-C-methyl-D-erythritol 4-phosphate cytidylyltransferase
MPEVAVILPAAGGSHRFGGKESKLLAPLAAKPLLRHSIAAFARRRDVRMVVIAVPPAVHSLRWCIADSDWITVCDGGSCRARSVWNAALHVPEHIDWLLIHDAARPLVSQELINRTMACALEHGAAAAALPVIHTIKRAMGPLPAKVQATLPRDSLWLMQTPQIVRRRDLLEALEHCPIPLEQVTDDVQLLELAGREVWLVAGEQSNLKITTPADLLTAETFWSLRPKSAASRSDTSKR